MEWIPAIVRELGATGLLGVLAIYVVREILPALRAISARLENLEHGQDALLSHHGIRVRRRSVNHVGTE